MMKKWVVFLAMSGLLIGTHAMAQIDTGENGIGFYFDQGATINCDNPGAVGPVDLFLCLTNLTAPDGVAGWECRVEITQGVYVLDTALSGLNPVNFGAAPDYIVGLGEPLPWAPSLVVAVFTIGVFMPDPIELFIKPVVNPSIPGVPAFADGGNPDLLIALVQSTGGPDIPVAVINGDCPVANEDATWGTVKSLYR
jgi:hypothetical protein